MMPPVDLLKFAREQLEEAVRELSGTIPSADIRIQLGLLAAHIAVAEGPTSEGQQESSAARTDDVVIVPPAAGRRGGPPPVRVNVGRHGQPEWAEWDVDLAVRILRGAKPSSVELVRALVAAGGSASVDQLRSATGEQKLHPMTQSLNMAGQRLTRLPAERLIQPSHFPRKTSPVAAYSLPPGTVELFSDALERYDRWVADLPG
ncbi:hypothetical protein [Nocardia goodfellowii]|uniref:MarR family transcriptional regulator n=1 Tax=Nocardia goodfellowii TaxID=882446 RepID=A0ABS4QRC0_9NOCA|nr:hypothetical protein [Nocardia goodfellowii]MBP2193599.1 hypothetical protein [Nocardia goodfellowii]